MMQLLLVQASCFRTWNQKPAHYSCHQDADENRLEDTNACFGGNHTRDDRED